VKHTGASHLLMRNTLRITVGTAEENAALLGALRDTI
jgi:histidinol-phosphate/aromatic aminotransferase/cobyric acid decarboxylase-like protein